MTDQIPTSEVLYRAADRLLTVGWWRRGAEGLGTCASNAIVSESGESMHAAHYALIAYLGGTVPRDIFDWNDAPERTAEEVIEALRACAVVEAAKENADVRESVAS